MRNNSTLTLNATCNNKKKKKKSHCESGLESVKMGWLFLYYHPAKHLDYQQRKLWLVLGACAYAFEHGKDDNKGKKKETKMKRTAN